MAAPTRNKKVVSKDSLRRLMKEKSAVGKSTESRVDHPCAKYNALEQLTCIVCKSVVKNDRLWNAHIMGRTHKEMVAALKHKALNQNVPAPSVPQASKRKSPDTESEVVAKKHKSNSASSSKNSIPNDFFDSKTSNKPKKVILKSSQKPKSILKNATTRLPNYSQSSEESEESEEETPSTSGNPPASGVPSDFFDAAAKSAAEPETKPLDPSMAEKLPEGFFDDPKKDAKVREIEYKDKMDEEWEMFQRAMKEQNTVSEQIQEEDDEQKTLERQAEEVDDQMHRWSQIHALAQKKETVMAEKDQNMDEGGADDAGSDAEADLDDLMDWRSKSAYKS